MWQNHIEARPSGPRCVRREGKRVRGSKKAIILWAAAVLWTAFMFYLAAQNGDDSGALSESILRIVLRIFPRPAGHGELVHTALRKLAHFGGFIIEGVLIAAAVRTVRRSGIRICVPVCAALAALNELTQLFAGGRSCEIRDMLIDFAGAAIGILIVWRIGRRKVD